MSHHIGQPPKTPTLQNASPALAVDLTICRQCAGMCCHSHPGLWVDPCRFEAIFFSGQKLNLSLLVDRLPRMKMELRQIGGIPVPAPRRSFEACVFLGSTGCTLGTSQRPCQCLALVPAIETLLDGEIRCLMPQGYGTGEARTRWEQFWTQRPGP